jgi:hypothetical protein
VREVLKVDIPRPRTVEKVVSHPRFLELREQCWQLLRRREAA